MSVRACSLGEAVTAAFIHTKPPYSWYLLKGKPNRHLKKSIVTPASLGSLVLLPYGRGMRLVRTEQIIHIKASSNYSHIYFEDGTCLVVSKVLSWIEQRLPQSTFLRVHRTHLINIQHLQSITLSNDSELVLRTGEVLPVAKRKRQGVKSVLKSLTIQ